MPGRRLAQMAVALAACRTLHRAGELDDSLLPVGKELLRCYDDEGGEDEWETTEGQARPGTTKRKQYYEKRVARQLAGRPAGEEWGAGEGGEEEGGGGGAVLYSFAMTLTCPVTDEQNTSGRVIHAPEETPRGFGFISRQEISTVGKPETRFHSFQDFLSFLL